MSNDIQRNSNSVRPANRRVEGEYTYWDCPSCGFPICTWTDCPECGWMDTAAWNRALKAQEGSA